MSEAHDHRLEAELVRLRSRLESEEARFRYVFERTPSPLWIEDLAALRPIVGELKRRRGLDVAAYVDEHRALVDEAASQVRILAANPASLRLFGASDTRDLLRLRRAYFAQEGRRVLGRQLVAIAEGETTFSCDVAMAGGSGERLQATVTVVLPELESLDRVLVSAARTPFHASFRESEPPGSLADSGAIFSDAFVGVLGHDLRNPLSAITTAAALLESRADSERISKPVGRILASADRMERMISQLLDFTRIRLGAGIQIGCAPADLARIARTVSDDLEAAHKMRIQLDVCGDTLGFWDGGRIAQLLATLGANACQHGASGGGVIVTVDGTAAAVVCLQVRNFGGIASDRFPSIFEPFRPSPGREAHGRGASGLGLGLYIARQIVLAHGGAIDVTSGNDGDTRFSVELPRFGPDGGEERASGERPAATRETP